MQCDQAQLYSINPAFAVTVMQVVKLNIVSVNIVNCAFKYKLYVVFIVLYCIHTFDVALPLYQFIRTQICLTAVH